MEITRFVPPTPQKLETRWRKNAKSLKVCRYARAPRKQWTKQGRGREEKHCESNRNSSKNEARQTCAVSGFNWHYSHKMHLVKKESDWQGTYASIKLGGATPLCENNKVCATNTAKSGDQSLCFCRAFVGPKCCGKRSVMAFVPPLSSCIAFITETKAWLDRGACASMKLEGAPLCVEIRRLLLPFADQVEEI